MELVLFPSDLLRQRAVLVPDPRTVGPLAQRMFEIMAESGGIGLAAPQVGILQRFFVLSLPRDRRRVLVNPEIVERSRRSVSSDEMCLSLPGITVDVPRAAWVTVRARDEHDEPVELRARGLLARAVQHELDHLNGVLCIDRIDPKRRERIARRLEALDGTRTRTRTAP